MATKIVTKNSSTASAVPTASDLVQGELAVNVADKRLFTEDNAGAIVELGTNPSGNVTFQDNGKAIFGAGSDLQIYHDGSDSYIKDEGTGNLYLTTNGSTMNLQAGSDNMVKIYKDAQVEIFHDASVKLATTSTGIDVTGTATMDGLTVSSNISTGIGAANANNYQIKVSAGTTGLSRFIAADTSDAGYIDYEHSSDSWIHRTAGAERMRIDSSGNVGIGTTNPVAQCAIGSAGRRIEIQGDSGTIRGFDRTATWAAINFEAASYTFDIAGTERMRIDSSGNALVGRTSSLSGQSGSVSANTVVSTHGPLSAHATNAGILEYYNDETLLRSYGANAGSGKLVFKVGGGGGSADSEAMRIDSSGNVGINTSSPLSKLNVKGTQGNWRVDPDSVSGEIQVLATTTANDGFRNFRLRSNESIFETGGTERMRIDSSGNVGIKTSSPLSILHVGSGGDANLPITFAPASGGNVELRSTTSTGSFTFTNANGSSEKMRIDSSGNLLVGTTASAMTAGGVRLKNGGGNLGEIALSNNSGSADYVARFLWGSSPTLVGNITVSASATAFNTSSDQRLKENIADADDAGSKIDAIQVRKFDWKADGSHQDYGMIAQELQAVAPEAVSGDADSEEMMGVDYSKLVPMLIKEIQSLRNRVAQLEE